MASRGINKVILVGNLGQDPEVRYMANGKAVASITLATSDRWRDKQSDEQKEHTEWHRVVLMGKLAEIAGQYLNKGSQIYIEGKLQTRKWQDQSGQERYTTEVLVDGFNGVMQMLSNRSPSGEQSPNWRDEPPAGKNKQTSQPSPRPPENSALPDDFWGTKPKSPPPAYEDAFNDDDPPPF